MTLGKVPVWLFDLDNTLHDASIDIFPQISRNMNAWIASNLGGRGVKLSDSQADALRQAFWRRYGATLLGVSRKPCGSATQFLKAAHRFDDLPSMIHAEKGLKRIFQRLPGRKILLTNSARTYAMEVLEILGIASFFERIISIETMCIGGRYAPKPSLRFFRHLPILLRVRPSRCILVEDDVRSLKAAKITGMRTVLVTQYLNRSFQSVHAYAHPGRKSASGRPSYVDGRISAVSRLLRFKVGYKNKLYG